MLNLDHKPRALKIAMTRRIPDRLGCQQRLSFNTRRASKYSEELGNFEGSVYSFVHYLETIPPLPPSLKPDASLTLLSLIRRVSHFRGSPAFSRNGPARSHQESNKGQEGAHLRPLLGYVRSQSLHFVRPCTCSGPRHTGFSWNTRLDGN